MKKKLRSRLFPLSFIPRFFLEPVHNGEEEYRDLRMSLQFHRRMPEDACIFTDTVTTETKDRDHRHSNGFPRSFPELFKLCLLKIKKYIKKVKCC